MMMLADNKAEQAHLSQLIWSRSPGLKSQYFSSFPHDQNPNATASLTSLMMMRIMFDITIMKLKYIYEKGVPGNIV